MELAGVSNSVFENKIQNTNFREGVNNNYLPFHITENYIKIHKKTTTNWVDALVINKINIVFVNTQPLTFGVDVSITFSVEGSNDNITYTNLSVSNNVMTFEPFSVNESIIINVLDTNPYKYYKVIFI